MTKEMDASPGGSRLGGWLDRHPTSVAFLAALGFFGFFQATFVVWHFHDVPEPAMAIGLAKAGVGLGIVTVLVLAPFALLLQRILPSWRRGERGRAGWAAFVALTAALSGWTVANQWVAGHLIPDPVKPWITLGATIVAALAVPSLLPPSRRWGRALALLVPVGVVFIFLPIGPRPPGGAEAGKERPLAVTRTAGPESPDVVLVTLDTVRADRLGPYGGSLTPQIDRLASEGVTFRRTLAASPWTVPSVASILTGLPTLKHGAGLPIQSGLTFQRTSLDAAKTTLAERFAAAGYRTRAALSNGFLYDDMGFTQGLEEAVNLQNQLIGAYFLRDLLLPRLVLSFIPPEKIGDYRAEGMTRKALEYLAEDGEGPLFLWVHYIDPHTPYLDDPSRLDPGAFLQEVEEVRPKVLDDGTVVGEAFTATGQVRGGNLWLNPEDKRRLAEYYDRAVAYVDQSLGPLFDALRERKSSRGVVLALVADHGEELWDHGHFEHGHDYYRELTEVPFLLWGPGIVPEGEAVEEVVGLVDVGPTLLELAGLDVPEPAADDEGRSLVARIRGEGEAPPRFSGGNLYGEPSVLVEEGRWRFILRSDGREELYDVVDDPGERSNVAARLPEVSERFRALVVPRLAAYLEQEGGTAAELSAETLKALQTLGYVQ